MVLIILPVFGRVAMEDGGVVKSEIVQRLVNKK
jgi:hypothetical protein